MLRNLLIYRMAIFNACAFACVGWAWQRGYVESVFSGDVSRLSYVIVGLFLIGLVSCFNRAAKVSRLLNRVKAGIPVSFNGPKLVEKSAHIAFISSACITLGLLGTVIGFSVALSGVTESSLSSAGGVQEVASHLMTGMRIAINTTLVGGFAALWLDICMRMLQTATVSVIEDAK